MTQTPAQEKIVPLPASLIQSTASQKHETLALLAAIVEMAFPGTFTGAQLDMNLATSFAGKASLTMSDITNWLASLSVPFSSLSSIVGDLQALHDTLVSQNNSDTCQLLTVNRQDMLRVWTGPDQEAIISQTVGPCYLLRVGYSDNGYGLYYLSLPGYASVQTKLTWNSVVAAGIADGIAIAPPKPPVDVEGAATALNKMSELLASAHEAHLNALHALGLAE